MMQASNEEAKIEEFVQHVTAFQAKLTQEQPQAEQMQGYLNLITEEQEGLQAMFDGLASHQKTQEKVKTCFEDMIKTANRVQRSLRADLRKNKQ